MNWLPKKFIRTFVYFGRFQLVYFNSPKKCKNRISKWQSNYWSIHELISFKPRTKSNFTSISNRHLPKRFHKLCKIEWWRKRKFNTIDGFHKCTCWKSKIDSWFKLNYAFRSNEWPIFDLNICCFGFLHFSKWPWPLNN